MSGALIYQLTRVPRPAVDAGAVSEMAKTWGSLSRSATLVKDRVDVAAKTVISRNQGAAIDAFAATVQGKESASQQLDRLSEAAAATAQAHETVAQQLRSAITDMDTIANLAAMDLMRAGITIFRGADSAEIIETARINLGNREQEALLSINEAYATVDLPPIIDLSEAEARGSVPPEVADIWKGLSKQEREELLMAMAEDIMEDWPEDAERPEFVFYSATGGDGEADWPGKGQQGSPAAEEENRKRWAGSYGGASGGDPRKVWMNVDHLGDEPTLISTMAHELQHVRQYQMREDYRNLSPIERAMIKADIKADPYEGEGSSIEEVERWEEYPYATDEYYYHQPEEVDARRGGQEYVDSLTEDKVKELL